MSILFFQGLLANGPKKPQDKYMRLENEIERANQKYIEDSGQQQQVSLFNRHLLFFFFFF